MTPRFRLITLVVLAVVVLVVLSIHATPSRRTTFLEKAIMEVVSSLQDGVVSSARGIESLWREYFYLAGLREENKALRVAVQKAQGTIYRLREQGLANERLRQMLQFASNNEFSFVGAEVVAWDPGPWFKTLTINCGGLDGVAIGMPVVHYQGVVGRVVEVSRNYSKVLLITDYNSSIDGVVQRSRVRGILAGQSERTCEFRYVRKTEDVTENDMIVTSGMGGVFPKGLPLGQVVRTRKSGQDIFFSVDVTPTVDFESLEEVLVILTQPAPF